LSSLRCIEQALLPKVWRTRQQLNSFLPQDLFLELISKGFMLVFSLWVVMKLIAGTTPANMKVFPGACMQCSLGYHIFIVGLAGSLRTW
jgi:hypothetical protein